MANFFTVSTSILVCILLAFLLFSPSSSHACKPCKPTSYMIKEACSKSKNQAFCLEFLISNSGQAQSRVNLTGLAQIAQQFAHNNCGKIEATLYSLIKTTTNPELKEKYYSCKSAYLNALDDLMNVKLSLESRFYHSAATAAVSAVKQTHRCKVEWKEAPPISTHNNALSSADEHDQLDTRQNFKNLCYLLFDLASYLSVVN